MWDDKMSRSRSQALFWRQMSDLWPHIDFIGLIILRRDLGWKISRTKIGVFRKRMNRATAAPPEWISMQDNAQDTGIQPLPRVYRSQFRLVMEDERTVRYLSMFGLALNSGLVTPPQPPPTLTLPMSLSCEPRLDPDFRVNLGLLGDI
jgi:hypothetical protein